VYGYVGNKMATFVMQALGLDVAAMNTVHFSKSVSFSLLCLLSACLLFHSDLFLFFSNWKSWYICGEGFPSLRFLRVSVWKGTIDCGLDVSWFDWATFADSMVRTAALGNNWVCGKLCEVRTYV
jgi:hypothetical protein